MEKYRSSADPSTGIHPYLPPPLPRSILSMFLAPFFFLIRLPILILTLALAFFLAPFLLLPQTLLTRVIARRLLATLSSPYTAPTPPRSRSRGKTPPMPAKGSLIVANYSSPTTILYLVGAYAPAFVLVDSDKLVQPTLAQLLSFAATGKVPKGCVDANIGALLRNNIVALLAEGTSSNGRAVLRFAPPAVSAVKEIGSSGRKVFAFGVVPRAIYSYWGVGGSFVGWLIRVLGKSGEKVQAIVTDLSEKDIADIQKVVARNAGIPALAIGAEGREDFERHWEEAGGMGR